MRLNRSGVSLVELMVAMVIMSVGVIGLVSTFTSIQRAVQTAKTKTLASNLAQEKMQILKQKNYYQVLITTDPAYNTDYTPAIAYDGGYFPAETILQGGVSYQRLTYVQVAKEDSGSLVAMPASTPDTGLKLITITTLWTQGGEKKKQTIASVLGNPNTVTANAIFSGTVRSATTNALISGALVNAAENMGWRDTTNASGVYSIGLSPGSYTLMASAQGYFSSFVAITAAATAGTTQNFTLVPMSSGTIEGTAWYNPGLVISQVVAATNTVCADGASHDVEYITLFNPTTAAVNIGATGASTAKTVNIAYLDETSTFDRDDAGLKLTHVSTYVVSHASYLIANATYFVLGGAWRTADAYYAPTAAPCAMALYCDVIRHDKAGGLELTRASDGAEIDKVGWDDLDNGSPTNEGTSLDLAAVDGLATGSQIVRISSPTDTPTLGQLQAYGGAYDSGDNADDFSFRNPIDVAPLGTGTTMPIIAGVPAIGAIISANDGLSDPTTAYNPSHDPPIGYFALPSVATGTWMLFISKDGYGLENDTVTIAAAGSVYTFPSSTTFLNVSSTNGFISGKVINVVGGFISPAISVSPGGAGGSQNASVANGRYFLRVTPGTVDVTANPGNANADYVSQLLSVTVDAGEVVNDLDFVLSQGGRITGFVTRDGINALPGVAVAALDINGYARDQQVSDVNGRFTTVNIATGTYEMTPALDSIETSAPTAAAATVAAGTTVDVGTFTITGALGTITGTVTVGGKPIATGALIVVSPAALSGTPPAPIALSSATLTGSSYYLASSQEEGTYSVSARGGSYLLYGYYNTISKSGAVTINAIDLGAVTVTPGATVTGKNFAW
jgi:type II secretory pathway pseudopilin PulG